MTALISMISLPYILQLCAIVHVMKTGRERYWIYVLFMIPIIGGLAYLFSEIVPDILKNMKVQQTVTKIVTPNKNIKQLEANISMINTVNNRIELADAYFEAERYPDAVKLYEECISNNLDNDGDVKRRIAKSAFNIQDFKKVISVLNEIRVVDDQRLLNWEMHLMLAQSYEILKENENAEKEYKEAITRFSHFEIIYNLGMFFLKLNKQSDASEQFQSIVTLSVHLPKFHKKQVKKWIRLSKVELANL